MSDNNWKIIFCQRCEEPTPPSAGMKTPFGFLCDYCMNTEDHFIPTEKDTPSKDLD